MCFWVLGSLGTNGCGGRTEGYCQLQGPITARFIWAKDTCQGFCTWVVTLGSGLGALATTALLWGRSVALSISRVPSLYTRRYYFLRYQLSDYLAPPDRSAEYLRAKRAAHKIGKDFYRCAYGSDLVSARHDAERESSRTANATGQKKMHT